MQTSIGHVVSRSWPMIFKIVVSLSPTSGLPHCSMHCSDTRNLTPVVLNFSIGTLSKGICGHVLFDEDGCDARIIKLQ